MDRFAELVEIVSRVRAECPWDREQTHETLKSNLVEEAYEVVDAIEVGGLHAGGADGAHEDVVDDRSTQAADVDGAGGGLRVVEDLGSGESGRQLVGPEHGRRAAS